MITAIEIENFKGIAEPVTIPIRPITLLFGKNSAGKSTVLQALHYLREVLENRRPDPDRTQLGSDTIDLGGFHSLVHRQDLERRIRIRVTVTIDADGVPFEGLETSDGSRDDVAIRARLLKSASREQLAARLSEQLAYERPVDLNSLVQLSSCWIEIITAWDVETKQTHIAELAVGLDDREFIRFEQQPELTPEIVALDFDHSVMRALDEGDDTELSESTRYRLWSLFEDSDFPTGQDRLPEPIALTGHDSLIPEPERPFHVDESFDSASKGQMEDGPDRYLFWSLIAQSTTGPLALLIRALRGIRYLGPIREVPPRNHRSPKTPDESRWAGGLGAWDALVRSPRLVDRASHYIRDVLHLGYSIRHEDRLAIDADGEVMAAIRLLASRYEEKDAAFLRQMILDPLEQSPRHPIVQLHDEQSDIDVDPADIGVGVSQVLPVVVGALDGGPPSRPCTLFAVEQPELHVHPAVQVALGDVFIDAIAGTDRTMLIETHSEHLLLRLLRRVREAGATTKPPLAPGDGYGDGAGYGDGRGDGVGDGSGHSSDSPSERSLATEDLSVVYVRPTKEGVELTPLSVTADGDFDEPWPEGFFDERDSELF